MLVRIAAQFWNLVRDDANLLLGGAPLPDSFLQIGQGFNEEQRADYRVEEVIEENGLVQR